MDIIALITFAVILALILLVGFIVIDRGRTGWNRAAAEATMRRRQLADLAERTEMLARSIDEQKEAIEGKRRQLAGIEAELTTLKRDLDSRELPFRYTAVPIASGDMYGPNWRFVARQPALAEGCPPNHPAALWDAGRPYLVGAPNQSEARSAMDRLLPRHRGFVIVAVGAAVSNAPSA
ncbi:MAG TPA: hypothetical protein VF194_03405 [Ferrovibrio sp.]|uniref:hypothetical protein n=1 Tax=Ferrovibrio sp. TaxID=1917215 RepID=UPI002ED45183